jgi:tetratricopeptide (TPR) repeat protein
MATTMVQPIGSPPAEVLARQFESWETNGKACEQALPDMPAALDWALTHSTALPKTFSAQAFAYNGFLLARHIGCPAEAFAICQRMIRAAQEARDNGNLQAWLGNQGLVHLESGGYQDAQALFLKQEAICVAMGNKRGLLYSYANQALALKALGHHDEALKLHKKEAALCRELGDKQALQCSYGNRALVLQQCGRTEEAWEFHSKEESICRERGDNDGLQRSFGNQALIFQSWGLLDEAITLLKKQEVLCLELGHKAALYNCYRHQAEILEQSGRIDEASMLKERTSSASLRSGIERFGYRA